VAYRWLLGLSRVVERTTRWVLVSVPPERPTEQVIADYRGGIAELRESFASLVAGDDRILYEERMSEIRELGADDALARYLITLGFLDQMLEILRIAAETGASVPEAGRAYYRVSELLGVAWVRKAIFEVADEDRWEQRAAHALADDLGRAHQRLVAGVLRRPDPGGNVADATDRLVGAREKEMARYRSLLEEIRAEPSMSLSGLSVAVREIGSLAQPTDRGALKLPVRSTQSGASVIPSVSAGPDSAASSTPPTASKPNA
jgi:glutamate dehydrogenase